MRANHNNPSVSRTDERYLCCCSKNSESQRGKLLSLEIDNVVEIDRNSSVGCRNWKSTRADAACPPVGIYSSAIAWGIFSRRYYGLDVCCDLGIVSIVRLRCLELV